MELTNKHLTEAIGFATATHWDQFDKGGNPYVLHPLKLMHWARHAGEDLEMQIACLLHDTAEDGENGPVIVLGEIKALFGERMCQIIDNLTKRDGEEYEAYLDRVKRDVVSAKVKCLDLRHNSDLRRLKGVRPKDLERSAKYQMAYMHLSNWIVSQETK